MDIQLKPVKVAQFLFVLAVGFTLAYLAMQLVSIYCERTFGLTLSKLDLEQSILRFYSATTLLLCSGLLLTIAIAKKTEDFHSFLYWLGLSFIFLLLAITKDTALHESLAAPVRSVLNISKIKFYACTYGIVVVFFSVLYLKFLLSLPRRTMLLLFIGGSAFVIGAFGIDLIVAYLGKSVDHHSMAYIGLNDLEGLVEISGVIVLVYALLLYISSELKCIRVRIAE